MAHPQCATFGVQRALLERVVAGAAVADAITPVGRAQEWGNTMVAEAMNLLAMWRFYRHKTWALQELMWWFRRTHAATEICHWYCNAPKCIQNTPTPGPPGPARCRQTAAPGNRALRFPAGPLSIFAP